MNPKDTGFFQQNIEKLILATGVLFLLVFGWWFLMGEPFTVELGRQSIGPDQIEPQIARRADTLKKRLDEPQSTLPDRPIPSYTQAFQDKSAIKPTALASLSPLAHPGLGVGLVDSDGDERPTYYLPTPPVAQAVIARKGHSVLSDQIPTRELEGMIKLVGNQQPRDFRYVSVAATFDMDEWIRRLQSGDKNLRIPQRWWNSMLGVTGVILQRQELDEVTGQWGNTVLVDKLPNQLAFKPDTQAPATSQQSKETIQLIRARQESIARHEFPLTSGNILWTPPSEDAKELDADGQRKLSKLNDKIRKLKEQIRRFQEQTEKTQQNRQDTQGRPGQRDVGRRRGGAGSEKGGEYGGGGGRRTARGDNKRQDATARTPQEMIRQAQEQLLMTKIERNELLGLESDALLPDRQGAYGDYGSKDAGYGANYGGYDDPYSRGPGPGGFVSDDKGAYPGGGPGRYPGAPGDYAGGYRAQGQAQAAEPQSRKIQVWAHDLSIEPGKTYRYRVVVAVLNPLYRQKRIQAEQRDENYDKLALGPDPEELESSDWSDPVHVDGEHYFFMVKGSAKAQTASVQVWRVHDGRWVSKEFDVRPGDPIGRVSQMVLPNGIQQQLDMNVGLVVVDLIGTGGGSYGGRDVRMLYLDPKINRISGRTVEDDRSHPDRIRLENELALEEELALSDAPAPGP